MKRYRKSRSKKLKYDGLSNYNIFILLKVHSEKNIKCLMNIKIILITNYVKVEETFNNLNDIPMAMPNPKLNNVMTNYESNTFRQYQVVNKSPLKPVWN